MAEDDLPPLGIGDLISRSLRLLAGHFGTLFPLAFVPALVLAVLNWMVVPPMPPAPDPAASPLAFSPVALAVGLLGTVVSFFVMGFMSLAALDALLGKRHSLGEYAGQSLRHLGPIVGLGILLSIAIGIGAVFLIVPALYI